MDGLIGRHKNIVCNIINGHILLTEKLSYETFQGQLNNSIWVKLQSLIRSIYIDFN